VGRDIIVAFDDIVHGTSNVYSSSFVELALGELESLALQVVAEPLTNPSDNVTVQIETSADGRNWVSKNATAEVFLTTPSGTTSSTYGYDAGLFPSLALVRLRVQLGGASNCSARIAVYVREGRNLGFIPSRLPGCMLWLRADLGVTLNGATVSSWADQSGNGVTVTQGTTSKQPTFNAGTAGVLNGLPTLQFAQGSLQILSSPVNYTNGGAASIFSAVAPVAGSFFNTRIFETLNSNGYYLGMGNAGGPNWRAIINGTFGTGAGTTANGNYLVSLNFTGAVGALYQNGTQVASDGYTSPPSTSNPYTIGGFLGGSTTTDFWNGHIAEVAFFKRVLTTTEVLAMHRYLGARYKISVP